MKGNGKGKAKKDCGCATPKREVHNHPSWYTREVVPQIGANWNVLSSIEADSNAFGASYGTVRINAAGYYTCVIAPPIDEYNSFASKVAEFYALLRRSNSGASNYTPEQLMAYILNVYSMRAIAHTAVRGLRATRATGPLFKDSPEIFSATVGHMYSLESAAYADNFNDLALLLKDMESLPIVDMAIFDRAELMFSTIFQDSETTRPALFSIVPTQAYSYEATSSGLVATEIYLRGLVTIANLISKAKALYTQITSDSIATIIRGDIIKAFGSNAFKTNLVSSLNEPIQISYNADLLSQIENAAMIGPVKAGSTLTYGMSVTPKLELTLTTANSVWGVFGKDVRPINFHGSSAPDTGTLLAITRLDARGTISDTAVTVTGTSGIVFCDFEFILDKEGTSMWDIGGSLNNSHSTTQSTAVAAYKQLAWITSVVDHMPAIVWGTRETKGMSFLFGVDNFAIMEDSYLMQLTIFANRSLGSIPGVTALTTAVSAAKR